MIVIFWLSGQIVFSQNRKTFDNYTGDWESPVSWNPSWAYPQSNVHDLDVTINGLITANKPLRFTGSSKLIVDDTLVIKGDLTIYNDNQLQVNEGGILIVFGNLTFSNKSDITADGYIVVTGNLTKEGTVDEGSFKGNDDPVRVFIGGTVSPQGLSDDEPDFELLNCLSASDPYPDSGCSYGNMEDLTNDQLYQFFLTSCMSATAGSNSPVCPGNTINLTSSGGTDYNWSGPGGFTSSAQNPAIPEAGTDMAEIYTVVVSNDFGCTNEIPVNITVNPPPEIVITNPSPECFPATADLTEAAITSGSAPGLTWSYHTDPEGTEEYSTPEEATDGIWYIKGTTTDGCFDIKPVSVNIYPPSYAEINETTDTICDRDQSELTFNLQGEGPWNLVYSDGTDNHTLEGINNETHISYINPATNDSATYRYEIVSLTDRYGCQAPATNISGLAGVRVYAYPQPDLLYSGEVCGNTIQLNANLQFDYGSWHTEHSATMFNPRPENPDVTATVTEYGTHSFTWTETNWQCSAIADIYVSFYEQPEEVFAGYDKVLQFIFEARLEAAIPADMPEAYGIWDVMKGNGKIAFPNEPNTRVTNLGLGENTFMWTLFNGVCEPVSVPVTLFIADLEIPNAFSPNNSGQNDRFIIKGIENTSSNKLTIFNRQGSIVYSSVNYRNEWDGRNHNGNPLPEDTFFYILEVDNLYSYNGFIVLKR